MARLHQRVQDARRDALHKLTSTLISENQVICIEDLHVKGKVRNRRLARAISDLGLGELARQLEYKAHWRGRTVIRVDRYFPSSKQCLTWCIDLTRSISRCVTGGVPSATTAMTGT